MSWRMLLVFAVCMAMAVVAFSPSSRFHSAAQPLFVLTLVIFVLGLLSRGIRRPVV